MSSGTMSQEEYKHHVSAVWRTTGILAVVTIVEVGIALLYDFFFHGSMGLKMGLNIFMIVATLVKAFYIVAVFMHMKYEKQALMLTVTLPTLFLVWAIIAFLWEGSTWLSLRQLWGF